MSDVRAAERLQQAARGNGNADESELLAGARSTDAIIPVLDRAAAAIHDAGRAIQRVANSLKNIGSDTARALSDTAEIKRHLKAITDREQVALKALEQMKVKSAELEQALSALKQVKSKSAKLKRGKSQLRKKKRKRHG
jgi:uncharacterized tellurite resistance protein B-like protein